MNALFLVLGIVMILGLLALAMSARIVQQYEEGVLFRLGQVRDVRKPG